MNYTLIPPKPRRFPKDNVENTGCVLCFLFVASSLPLLYLGTYNQTKTALIPPNRYVSGGIGAVLFDLGVVNYGGNVICRLRKKPDPYAFFNL